ncbi:MAG: DNA repair protein RecO [Candidatus Promineifilaceae bacterium]
MPREKTYRTEAIVLRRTDFGEADRLLTLYSRDYGKIRAIAKGARKPQSRKTGHVELFMRTNFFIATGRDLDIITQVETVDTYAPLRQDLVRATYAAYMVELLDRFTPDEDKHIALYDLLRDALGWLAAEEDVRLAARYYELRLLSQVGYQPQLFQCVVSGDPIEEQDQFLSAELGGLIAPGYEDADRRARPVSAVVVKVLRYLQTRSWDTVRALKLKNPLHRELEAAMHFYLIYILERELKSVDFLHRLRHEVASGTLPWESNE